MRTRQTPVVSSGVSATLVVVLSAATVLAQAPAPPLARYREAVEVYRAGDVNRAMVSVNTLSSAEIKSAVDTVNEEDDWRLRTAAAMLHTEIAIGRTGASPLIPQHLGFAETLLGVPPREGQDFVRRWYGFAGQFLLAHSFNPDIPQRFIERGLRAVPVNPQLHVVAGILGERLARLNDVESQDREVRAQLEGAERAYRLALKEDPDLVDARLRLARVLFLRGRLRDAREALAAVQAVATDPHTMYLAHLFLGAVHQAEDRWEAARVEYEAALALGPQRQTPYIALSYVEQAAGNVSRARDLAATVAELPNPARSDPWFDYPTGVFDIGTLRWLRAEVRP